MPAYANPEGGSVAAGQANISSSDKLVTITQQSDRAIIDWRSFDIAPDETTRFSQPSVSSVTLNRVNAARPSEIAGQLQANGHVIIINPAGVFFTPTAQVDVGGIVASTADTSNERFMAGQLQLDRPGQADARVRNEGRISAREAGLVGLVAPTVENSGVINAQLGRVQLAAGDTATVDLYGDGLINVAVSDEVSHALVSQSGTINAQGGTIQMTAAAGRYLVDSLVSNSGTLNAPSVALKNGRVIISAQSAGTGNAHAEVSGAINVSGDTGGSVDVLADHVELTSSAKINASGAQGGGQVRIGGDYQGGNASVQNARTTTIASGAQVNVDATSAGNGGRAIVWADDSTHFAGSISARGGDAGGDGGFVEVSGKKYLSYKGLVDTQALRGETGLLLLDPTDLIIASGTADSAADGTNTFRGSPSNTAGTILGTDTSPSTIYESELEGIAATTNIALTATNSITINDLADNNLNLAQNAGRSVTFTAAAGGFIMADINDTITTAGGTLSVVTSAAGAATIGNLATNGGLITLNLAGAGTVSGVISGTGTALTKSGTGALTLNGNNTYTGTTTLSGGTVTASSANAFGSGTLVLNGSTLQGSGPITFANAVSLAANSTIGGSSALTFNGTLTNTMAGNPTLTISNSAATSFGNVNLSNSATSRTVTFAVSGTGLASITGTVANGSTSTAGGLTKSGTGTLLISGSNTHGGATTVSAGTLTLDNAAAAGTGTLTLSGGTLQGNGTALIISSPLSLTASTTIGGTSDLSFNGLLTQTAATTLTVNNTGATTFGAVNLSNSATNRTLTVAGTGNTSITGIIANGSTSTAGALTKSGTGTLTLSGINTYGGATTLSAGTLRATNASALGAGTLSLGGGTLQLAADTATSFGRNTTVTAATAITSDRLTSGAAVTHTLGTLSQGAFALTVGAGSNVASGTAGVTFGATNFTGSPTFTVNTGAQLNLGALTDGGTARTITKSGAGTLNLLAAAASWATASDALTINNGTVLLSASNAFGTGTNTNVTVNSTVAGATALLDLNGFNQSIGTLTFGGTGATATSVNNVATGSGTLTLGGNVTYTSTNNPLGSTLSGNLALGGTTRTFTINDSTNASADLTIDAIISGTGGLTKAGAGTLVLNGVNTYSGTTTTSAGTLRATNASALGAGTLTLGGGTLQLAADTATNFGRNTTVTAATTVTSDRLTSGAAVTHTLGTLSHGAFTLTVGAGSNVASGTAGVTFGATTLTGNPTYTLNTGAQLNLGALSNGGTNRTITKSGVGVLNFAAAAGTWSTTGNALTINNGTALLGATNALGTGSNTAITVNSTAAGATALFDLNGFNQTVASLTFGGTGATATSVNNVATGAGTLTLAGNVTFTNTNNPLGSTLSGNLALGGATRTFTIGDSSGTSADLTISATISGSGAGLTKAGAGTLVLSGTNTYNGTTTVSAGTLSLSGGSAILNTGTVSLVNAATTALSLETNETFAVLTGGGATGGNLILNGATLTVGDATSNSFAGIISGTGGLTKVGAGGLTLSGTNTFSGATTLSAGTLTYGAANALGDSSDVSVASGATLNFANFSDTINSITSAGTVTFGSNATLTTAGSQSYTGQVTGATTTLVSTGGGDITATNSSNDFTGNLVITTSGTASVVDANALALGASSAASLTARALGGNLTLNGAVQGTNTSGTALLLTASGNFINNVGASALQTGTGGRWLVYSTTPASDTIGSLSPDFRRFSCTYGSSCPTLGSGNGLLYTTTPSLTVTPAAQSLSYGDAPTLVGYGYSLSGYLGSDASADSLAGTLTGTSAYSAGSAQGTYNLNYASGTLTSAMGYSFTYANNASALSVGARTITATIQNQSVDYGTATPTLSKDSSTSVVWGNLYSGDTSSAISTATFTYGGATAGANNNAGTYTLGLSGISATNYVLGTVTTGTLTVSPYTLSVTANAASKTYGATDPALTYTHGTLQNGDTASVFTGALARAAGESVSGGPYAISVGTLAAGSNYTLSFTGANLTINPYTLAVSADNQSKAFGAADPVLTYTYGTLQNGDTASVFTGALSRVAGETAAGSPYTILQGTLSAGSNYTLSFTPGQLTITPAAAPPADTVPTSVVQQLQPQPSPINQGTEEVAFARLGDLEVEIDNTLIEGGFPQTGSEEGATSTGDADEQTDCNGQSASTACQ